MMLLKDPLTSKKSITITMLFLTFAMCAASVICRLLKIIEDNGIIYATLSLHAPYIGVYWNKKLRASKEGLEFLSEGKDA